MSKTPAKFPKLQRAISLLVVGHSSDRLSTRGAAALARLDAVLVRFAQIATDATLADSLFGPDLYAESPCTVRLLTGDCDGVDAHAQASARRLGLPVQLIEAAEPAEGKSSQAGAVRFGCPTGILAKDDVAHALRDEFALLHADVLIAVWDGEAARGRYGGAVRTIQRAIEVGTPVLWIDLDGQLRELDYAKINGETQFQLANSVFRRAGREDASVFGGPLDEPITATIRLWLDPLAANAHETPNTTMLRLYAQERPSGLVWERAAGLVDRVCCALVQRNRALLKKAFKSGHTVAYEDFPAGVAIPGALHARFRWSDVRANIAAGRHRSGVWLLYLLSAFAVMAAVAGTLHLGVEHEGWSAYMWPMIEGAILLSILSLVFTAKENRWHERWLGQRLMAEQLRYLAMTRPFLGLTMFFSLPLFRHDAAAGRLVLQHAEAWILRRALITEGPLHTADGYDLHLADQATLAASLNKMIGTPGTRSGQLGYHENKTRTMKGLHSAMHGAARWLFGLSLVAVILHFVPALHEMHASAYLLFATAFFPALAASLHGIQTKLEIARVESLSHQATAELSTMWAVIEQFLHVAHSDPWQRTLYLRTAALRAAHIMSEEAQSWRDLIAQQDTDLPA